MKSKFREVLPKFSAFLVFFLVILGAAAKADDEPYLQISLGVELLDLVPEVELVIVGCQVFNETGIVVGSGEAWIADSSGPFTTDFSGAGTSSEAILADLDEDFAGVVEVIVGDLAFDDEVDHMFYTWVRGACSLRFASSYLVEPNGSLLDENYDEEGSLSFPKELAQDDSLKLLLWDEALHADDCGTISKGTLAIHCVAEDADVNDAFFEFSRSEIGEKLPGDDD